MRRTLAALVLAMTPPLAVLPLPTSAQAQQVVVVRSGETLSEIAERHNVSLSRLMQANGISEADLVMVGQRLTIPGSGSTARTASGSASAPRTTQGTAPYTVKSGETLSEIADRFNTSTARLIQINGISDPNLVMSGTRLQVPMPAQRSTPAPAAAPAVNRNASEHVVQPGESLSLIAERYGTSVSRLVALNQLGDPELVMVGSRLKLRGTPPAPRPAPRPAAQPAAQPRPTAATPAVTPAPQPVAAAAPAASQQPAANSQPATTQQAPTLQGPAVQAPAVQPAPAQPAPAQTVMAQASSASPIATPIASPIAAASPTAAARTAVASTTATASATAATATTATATAASAAARSTPAKTAASAPASAATTARSSVSARPTAAAATTTAAARPAGEWRNYGPLQVDWSKIQPMGGSYVAPSLNSEGQPLYVAVNCTARKINVTSQAGQWRVWENPSKDFEFKLVQDICQAKSN